MDTAEIALVRHSLESALRDTPPGELRAVLAKLGWHELRDVEPAAAVGELFEAQGRLLAATPALDLVVAGALGVDLPDDTTIVHPALAGWDGPPGRVDGAAVAVDGLVLAGAVRAARLLVPCEDADGRPGLVEVPCGGHELEARPAAGFDESLGLVRIRGRVGTGPPTAPPAPWTEVAAAARRALGHELVGLAQAMLDPACRHVTDRIQFGRPVAAFQAVRHRLADVFVAVTAARAVLGTAWRESDPLAADGAKALAGRAALLAGTHCLQVTGAMGFTWEHDLHRSIRRAHVVDALYGAADGIEARIGRSLLAGRSVPRLGDMPA